MTTFGKTWWGKHWLDTFNDIDFSNRLPRGRTYARTGKAYDITINGNIITAKVTGSRPRPYKVSVTLSKLSQKDQVVIKNLISKSPSILSEFINKRLSTNLYQELLENKIKLFPSNWTEVQAKCNCPDFAIPCKHIAAVIYLISAEIDKNPFMLFTIHDCDIIKLIGANTYSSQSYVRNIVQVGDLIIPYKKGSSEFKQETLDEIDFAKIPILGNMIDKMLSEDPPFYEKNLHKTLQSMRLFWQKNIQKFLVESTVFHQYAVIKARKKNKEISEEEVFLNLWLHPESWDTFHLAADKYLRLQSVFNGTKEILSDDKESLDHRVAIFLATIPPAVLHRLNPEIRFMNIVAQFARVLLERSAYIPQLIQHKQEVFIRWVPALFDENIKAIFEKLVLTCPAHLVSCEGRTLSAHEQVKTALSIILIAWIKKKTPASLGAEQKYKIFKLFFEGDVCTFIDFNNKEVPSSIDQWLSKLYLSGRNHKLYLLVKSRGESFEIEVQASPDGKKEPVGINKILSSRNSQAKLAILSDISLLIEYIPELSVVVDKAKSLMYNLDDFAPIFLKIFPVLRAMGIVVILPKVLQKLILPKLNLRLTRNNKTSQNMQSFLSLDKILDFDWQISLGDKKVTLNEFKKMIKESRGLVHMIDQYLLLDEKEIELLLKKIDKLPEELSQFDLMQASLAGEFDDADVDLDGNVQKLFDQLHSYIPVQIPKNLNATLRPYQERGYNWLIQNMEAGFGSILADDMGLGKTVQVIASILHYKNNGMLDNEAVLVVAPTSLLSNWEKEIKKFAPSLIVHVYHGNQRTFKETFDVMITSYGLARRDKNILNQKKWFVLVIDEAQNIKNPGTAQTKAVKSIVAHHKIAMSGTPVENRLLEYWSIFDFTNKHYLGTPKQFKDRFATLIEKQRDKGCLERFKKITSPFILRRLKGDKTVIKDLPDKVQNNKYCSLTAEQAALYQEVVNLAMKNIESSEGIERKGLVLKLINDLKQVCNHPSQFVKKSKALINQSGKMGMLEEVLQEIAETDEKTLIFTQYTQMGDIIAMLIQEKFGIEIPFLHGGLSRKVRDEIVSDFQTLPQKRILIVSLKAGGTGLNLTAANHVIHYDLWWNPAVEDQATDRAYRIGQQKKVIVHRFLTTGTFEERIDEMIQSKKELANLTIGAGEGWITEMNNEQIKDLVNMRK